MAIMINSDGMDHLSVGQRLPSGRLDRPIANKYLIRYAPGTYGYFYFTLRLRRNATRLTIFEFVTPIDDEFFRVVLAMLI